VFWKQYTQVQMLITVSISSSSKYFLLNINIENRGQRPAVSELPVIIAIPPTNIHLNFNSLLSILFQSIHFSGPSPHFLTYFSFSCSFILLGFCILCCCSHLQWKWILLFSVWPHLVPLDTLSLIYPYFVYIFFF
jgi:hypothetical protein